MNIPLLIIPFLLNSLVATTNGNKIGISPNISTDEIACNYCWIHEDERTPKIFKSSHIVKCDKNKIIIRKKSEYRCVVNLAYTAVIDIISGDGYNSYNFALTATKKTNCKYSDTLCTLSLYDCRQSYICCDENFCNSPDNINFRTSTYMMNDNEILSQCLSMSFKHKKVKATKNLVTAKGPIKLLKTNYCDSAGAINTKPQIVLLISMLIFHLKNLVI